MSTVISSAAEGTVVALAGRRIDAEPADEPRFPFARVGAVREAIAAKLKSEQARALVCSAACGADLVALDVAQDRRLRTRVILPFSAQEFRNTSVVDRPRAEFWGELFDRVIAKVRADGDLVELDRAADDADAYSAANRVIVEEARRLAQGNAHSAQPIAMIVWNGAPRGASDSTKEFADLAEASGFRVIEVPTLGDPDGNAAGMSAGS
jgi:hypothetical protein